MQNSELTSIGQSIIKHQIRYDLEIIANLIEEKAKVLDIGCGDGELLEFLKNKKNVDARGLEISQNQVSQAIKKGLSVIQGDAEEDLTFYPDASFKFAILSQTIQSTKDPKKMLIEMMRIAEYGVVSLPNFANYKNRFHLLFKGKMPVNKNIPYQWYDTPNIHFCSIADFENLCLELNFTIEKRIFLTNKHQLCSVFKTTFFANLFAEYGIFLIKKNYRQPNVIEEFVDKKTVNLDKVFSYI
jgi:methionine biosynthesis protein MetW